ncbi:18278_t:CDS:2, partial [Entrophospora sp. SA101]
MRKSISLLIIIVAAVLIQFVESIKYKFHSEQKFTQQSFFSNNNYYNDGGDEEFGGCNSTIYCNGELLKLVQLSRIFDDSKTFVDMPTKKPVAEVLQAVQKLLTQSKLNPPTRSDVISFLSTYFDKEGQELLSPENYDDKH